MKTNIRRVLCLIVALAVTLSETVWFSQEYVSAAESSSAGASADVTASGSTGSSDTASQAETTSAGTSADAASSADTSDTSNTSNTSSTSKSSSTGSSSSGTASKTVSKTSSKTAYAKALGTDAKVKKGYYYIQPSCSSSCLLSVKGASKKNGAAITLRTKKKKTYQLFYIAPNGDGTYTIKNKNSGKYLEPAKGSKKAKTAVRQVTKGTKNSEKWYIFKSGGKYVIQSAISGMVLEAAGSKGTSGTQVRVNKWNKSKGEKWSLTSNSSSSGSSKYKTSKRVWNDKTDYVILANIIGAVESGGQIYGNLDYDAYDDPYKNSPNEYTITIGWAQCYGPEASELLNRIYKLDKKSWAKIDNTLPKKQRIVNYLNKNITKMHWRPNSKQKAVIKKLLNSAAGRKAQLQQFTSYMSKFVKDCKKSYTDNAWAVVMYCQIRHLGGKGAVNRIFRRCKGNYSLSSIRKALDRDKSDTRSRYQVGDSFYNSRHNCVCSFLQKYMA